MGASDSVDGMCTLRTELCGSDPLIWRELEVHTSISLKTLHHIIQAAMGWFDYHLCEFTIGERDCPPEDCGGIAGFKEKLEIAADPEHPEYEETRGWPGDGYDPAVLDEGQIRSELQRIARRRTAARARVSKPSAPEAG